MPYPNSACEFRIFVKQDATQELQVRYINEAQGYVSKWQPIPIVYDNNSGNSTT